MAKLDQAPFGADPDCTLYHSITGVINEQGRTFANGIGWEKIPRQTRSTPHQRVTGKTKGAVEAFSEEAQSVLVNFLACANGATSHAKGKTLMKADTKLVKNILSKHGL